MKTIDFSYSIEWSDRKTLGISVLPDCSIVVRAPRGTDKSEIDRRLLKRADWIARQVRSFKAYDPRATPRHFVAGEGHLFLGKMYRLTLSQGPQFIEIRGDRLLVSADNINPSSVKVLLERWYRSQAHRTFPLIMRRELLRMGFRGGEEPRLAIRKMERRWGSLSPKGLLSLNFSIIKAPEPCIEYVICHELCHAEFPNHNSEFYARLTRQMPDWESRKLSLEMLLK